MSTLSDTSWRVYRLLTTYFLTYHVWQSPRWVAERIKQHDKTALTVDMVLICVDELISNGYIQQDSDGLAIWSRRLPFEWNKQEAQ